MAILYLGYRQSQNTVSKVSRSKIMSLSYVNTLPTYHKYFKELQVLGYIKYLLPTILDIRVKLIMHFFCNFPRSSNICSPMRCSC